MKPLKNPFALFFIFFFLILAIVFATRGGHLNLAVYDSDALAYDSMARAVVTHHTLEVPEVRLYTYREPVYGLFIALVYAIAGFSPSAIILAQIAILALFLVKSIMLAITRRELRMELKIRRNRVEKNSENRNTSK